mgnify:CR=1 FL=1
MWCFIVVFVYMVFVSVQLDTGYSFTSVPNSNPTIDTEIGTFGDIVVFYIDLHWFKIGSPKRSKCQATLWAHCQTQACPPFTLKLALSSQHIAFKPTYCNFTPTAILQGNILQFDSLPNCFLKIPTSELN